MTPQAIINEPTTLSKTRLSSLLVAAAAFVVLVAGMKAASSLLVLLLLSLFITTLVLPLFSALQKMRLPTAISLLVVMLLLLMVTAGIATVIATSAAQFTRDLPSYEARLQQQSAGLVRWLKSHDVTIDDITAQYLNGDQMLVFTGYILTGVSALLSQFVIVMILVLFMLFEAATLPSKLQQITSITKQTRERLALALDGVRNYMGVKALTSLLTGILVATLLVATGTDFPILLGFLAFLLNFVPNVGSVAAAVPGILLAFAGHGTTRAVIVTIGYLVANLGVSNLLEPRAMGHSLGLSPLVVVMSLVFWGWVLGPAGMFLSVPLTMAVKIFMEGLDETRDVALLFGSAPPHSLKTPPPEPAAE